jgi:Protein of unknown function (DUF3489)
MATKSKKTAASKRTTAAKAKRSKATKAGAAKTAKANSGKPAAKAGAPREGTKNDQLLALLAGKGATSAELCKALGWQPHTLRAAISRVQGKVERSRVDGVTSYRLGA